jgi:hypothetical protein
MADHPDCLQYPFELDTFQKEAIYHMEVGDSVFVAADADFGGIERLLEVAEFLVRERFDRRRVDGAGHVPHHDDRDSAKHALQGTATIVDSRLSFRRGIH